MRQLGTASLVRFSCRSAAFLKDRSSLIAAASYERGSILRGATSHAAQIYELCVIGGDSSLTTGTLVPGDSFLFESL